MDQTSNLHVVETRTLTTPTTLKDELPLTASAAKLVATTRNRIRQILRQEDDRLLVIVGPCSIHDVDAALDYARRLAPLRRELADRLEIVMRVYFEKPRTTTGWKGLINDPHLNDSYDINTGLRLARKLLLDLAEMGMPSATELLDPIIPQYIADLISWSAIGARTTESQTHREMASGLSMPVGFKNSTDGNLLTAVHAVLAANHPHHFLGIDTQGLASIVTTTGNPDCHIILRGGKRGPNYSRTHIKDASDQLAKEGINSRLMIDCSHGNSAKDHNRQPVVLQDIAEQIAAGSRHCMGVMIESHLVAGQQSLPDNVADFKDRAEILKHLTYGQSITDACVDFDTTAQMLTQFAALPLRSLEPSAIRGK